MPPASAAIRTFRAGSAEVRVFPDAAAAAAAGAREAAGILRGAVSREGSARILVAAGASQEGLWAALARVSGIEWRSVEAFAMDEYLGVGTDRPGSLGGWLRARLQPLRPGRLHVLAGDGSDPAGEARRYAGLLRERPIDLCLAGVGENGHLAFNEPGAADPADPEAVRRVTLAEASRARLAASGLFGAEPPREALTVTLPVILGCLRVVAIAPEARKAGAAKAALEGPVGPACPASFLRDHPDARILLDAQSASLLATG